MKKFLVEVSARHVHLCREDVEILFGKDYILTPVKPLSQTGQFACAEKVTIIGPKGELTARILGPERKASQVEITLTEARKIGVEALVKESGHHEGTSGILLVGPKGQVEIKSGVIAAKRHIHMSPSDAEEYGVKNGDIVAVKVVSGKRPIIFGDVVIRVHETFRLAMHLDTDEGNAAGLSGNGEGELVSF